MILDQDFSFCLFSRIKNPDIFGLSAVIPSASTSSTAIVSTAIVSAASTTITAITTTAAIATITTLSAAFSTFATISCSAFSGSKRSQFALGEYFTLEEPHFYANFAINSLSFY
jgi:hypothetical protein